MKNQPNTNSKAPLIIIGVALVAVLVGGWWFYSQSKTPSANRANANRANANRNTPLTTTVQGATPPNMLGSPTASVTVEEFADYQCGACASVHPIMKEITGTYGSRIKFIFRNFPLQSHDKAYDMATAAEAAGLQGKFWDMQNLIFSNQNSWASNPNYRTVIEDYARKLDLDVERLKTDMAGTMVRNRVDADLSRGRALNVGSTPTVYVNGIPVPFPEMSVDGLRRIIDGELAKAPAAAPPAATTPAATSGNANATNAKPANAANANK